METLFLLSLIFNVILTILTINLKREKKRDLESYMKHYTDLSKTYMDTKHQIEYSELMNEINLK
jgi:hypothetical protein